MFNAQPQKSLAHLKAELKEAMAHPIFREQNISTAWREYGAYYDSIGDYEQAIKCYKRNLPICLRNHQYARSKRNMKLRQGFAVNLGNAYHDLALSYKYMKDYKNSEKYDLDYLNVMESAFGKWSKRLVPPVQSLVHLYQEAQEADKLKSTLARLQQLYTKNKPDPNDEFFRQAISYTSSLPTAKGNQKGVDGAQGTFGRMMVQLDDNYFRILILSEQVKQAYQAQEHKKAEKLCLEAIKEFAQNPAKSTFLEFLISIYVNMEKWESVADTLQQLIDMHPELSAAGQYNLEPHVALFRKFTTLSPSAQSQLKRVYAQLAGPTGLPSANINRLQSLVNSPSEGTRGAGSGLLLGRDGESGFPSLNLGGGARDVMDDLPPTPGMFNFEKMGDGPHSQHVVSDEQKAKAKARALQMSKELDDILLMLKQRKQQAGGGAGGGKGGSGATGSSKDKKERKHLGGGDDEDEDEEDPLENSTQDLDEDLSSLTLDSGGKPKGAGGKKQHHPPPSKPAQQSQPSSGGGSKKKKKKKGGGAKKEEVVTKPTEKEIVVEDEDGGLGGAVDDDEPLTLGGISTSAAAAAAASKKISGYLPGTLNKCGNPGCEKKEQTENQFKLCSRCKKACYCTIECQRKAWRKHKLQCQKI